VVTVKGVIFRISLGFLTTSRLTHIIRQLKSAKKYSGNASKHVIFKTPLDFASPLAHDTKTLAKSNTSVKIVNNLVGEDNPLDTSSIDQFDPTPKEIAGEVVHVERRKNGRCCNARRGDNR